MGVKAGLFVDGRVVEAVALRRLVRLQAVVARTDEEFALLNQALDLVAPAP